MEKIVIEIEAHHEKCWKCRFEDTEDWACTLFKENCDRDGSHQLKCSSCVEAAIKEKP